MLGLGNTDANPRHNMLPGLCYIQLNMMHIDPLRPGRVMVVLHLYA